MDITHIEFKHFTRTPHQLSLAYTSGLQNQRNVSQEFQEPLHNSITIFEVLHLALEQQKKRASVMVEVEQCLAQGGKTYMQDIIREKSIVKCYSVLHSG